MYRSRFVIVALACLGVLTPVVHAADKAVTADLKKLNARLVDATRRKDTKATLALMTSDFKMKKMTGGWQDRAQTEALLTKSWPSIEVFRSWRIAMRDVKVSGDNASALVEDQVVADVKDAKGLFRTVVMQTITHEEWRRVNGVWKFRRMEDLKSRMTAAGPAYVPWKQVLRNSKTVAAARAKAGPKPGIKEADARRLLEAAYAASRKAFRAKDVAGVMATATPDYAVEYPSHTSNRWQVEQDLRNDLKGTKSVSVWTAKIGALVVTGDTFTADITEHKVSVVLDSHGKPHQSDVVDTTRDVWVKTPAGWRNRKTIILGTTVKVDGRLQAE